MENNCVHNLVSNFMNQIKEDPTKNITIQSGYQSEAYQAIAKLVVAMSYYDSRVDIYNYCVGDDGILLYNYL